MLSILAGAAIATMAQCGPRERGAHCNPQTASASGVLLSEEYQTDASADSVYWQPPTRVTTSLSGHVLITVGRLANMARQESLFDQGWLMKYWIHIDFYGDMYCNGPVIHANNYAVAELNYKDDRPNVSTTAFDQRLRDLGGAAKCIRSSFHWEGH